MDKVITNTAGDVVVTGITAANQTGTASGYAETNVTITGEEGLHARPAGLIAKKASVFQSKIEMSFDGQSANAKSIMMMMSLGIEKDSEIKISATGTDAELAVKSIEGFIKNGFIEP